MFKASQADLETQVDLVLGSVFVRWLFLRLRISGWFQDRAPIQQSHAHGTRQHGHMKGRKCLARAHRQFSINSVCRFKKSTKRTKETKRQH